MARANAQRLSHRGGPGRSRPGAEQETQKAIATAEQIMIKAREAAAQDHDRMLVELKTRGRPVGGAGHHTVTGKILTAEDQRRLAEEDREARCGVAMKIGKRAKREAKQLFRFCLVDGMLDESRVRRWRNAFVAAGRRDCPAILAQFSALGEARPRPAHGHHRERHALAGGFAGYDRGGLTRRYGRGLATAFAHRPALIGGTRIQVGSDVYDGSVRAGLMELKKSF